MNPALLFAGGLGRAGAAAASRGLGEGREPGQGHELLCLPSGGGFPCILNKNWEVESNGDSK